VTESIGKTAEIMHLPVMAMVPGRPVLLAARFKLGKKAGETLHPMLLNP
jgi:hypothetical protein